MRFEWDPRKSEDNLRHRGFDFAFASLVFDGPVLEREDQRRDYGERRVVAIGIADGLHLTVLYSDRRSGTPDMARRIISARRSNRRERRAHAQTLANST